MVYYSKEDRSCFHCGLTTHPILLCPNIDKEQTELGKKVQLAFCNARKAWYKEFGKKKKERSATYNYLKVKNYLQSLVLPEQLSLQGYLEPLHLLSLNPEPIQNHSLKIQKAAREFFSYILPSLRKNLIAKLIEQSQNQSQSQSQPGAFTEKNLANTVDYHSIVRPCRQKNAKSPWTQTLNQAVKEGIPADFSNGEDNRFYTIQKMETRIRYLHHLIMDDNELSLAVRQTLVDCLNAKNGKTTVRVCSLGGGPAYDHVAIWMVLLFIFNMNKSFNVSKVLVQTDVFDLFGEWEEIVNAMDDSLARTIEGIEDSEENDLVDVRVFQRGGACMKQCDIREGLDRPINDLLKKSLEDINIICFSFVIHENSSIILSKDKNEPLIQGAARDIMERAEVGTLMVCMDSNNCCWPAFKATARAYGWQYFGSEERQKRISLGPNQFVIFKRIKYGTFPLDEAVSSTSRIEQG
mmetsp:Transcript_27584/g.55201  ORF Transcript_27584/g.55201 Transcript_27584/m.55201 type:complete len:465 (+) Transcript_27584:169-1563(+)|eukprot:CAMPEP_0194316786 /NCGR_PEP_ID=MMETSP0171-20130528/13554_1 /TAXON_ID=218684 /ORGANISM="Corethron pennatum, Strain L29A3" /LENGTH=464 /DNA_ID=CAMNT_0039073149 /DNA_START=89 /DNA_END=1483 /DNA_ORIENTATION=+